MGLSFRVLSIKAWCACARASWVMRLHSLPALSLPLVLLRDLV
jgi:hypothetical protein